MGVLEDAIREHLELRRKHGASDEELEEQETEALGPARRDFAAEPEAETADGDQAPAEAAEPLAPGADEAEPLGEEPTPQAPDGDTQVHEQPPAEPEPPTFREEGDEPLDEEARGEREDVLEETPDFLQETPEHDRLWFEQKPPRDFDFD